MKGPKVMKRWASYVYAREGHPVGLRPREHTEAPSVIASPRHPSDRPLPWFGAVPDFGSAIWPDCGD